LLEELQHRHATAQAETQAALSEAQAEVQALRADLSQRREVSATTLREVEDAREALIAQRRTAATEAAQAAHALETERAAAGSARERLQRALADVAAAQEEARSNADNYQRELQNHAASMAARRQAAEEQTRLTDQALDLKSQMLAQRAAAAAAMAQAQAQAEGFKAEAVAARDAKTEADSAAALLHKKLQNLAAQVASATQARLDLATATAPHAAAAGAGTEAGLEQAGSRQETRERNSQDQEYLQLLRFSRRELEAANSKAAQLQSENRRIRDDCTTAERALAQAREQAAAAQARLQQQQQQQQPDESEGEETDVGSSSRRSSKSKSKSPLKAGLSTELALLKESNAHLRVELQQQKKHLAAARADAAKWRAEVDSSSAAGRAISAEISELRAALEAEKADAIYWKDRLHALVNRYNDVDPEAHRQVHQHNMRLLSMLARLRHRCFERESESGRRASLDPPPLHRSLSLYFSAFFCSFPSHPAPFKL
jgi:nucleoprotein TPR